MFRKFKKILEYFKINERFKDIQEFYKFIDEISQELKDAGFQEEGEKLYEYHEIAWTTSSELLGMLRIVLKEIRKQKGIPVPIREDIELAIKTIGIYFRR